MEKQDTIQERIQDLFNLLDEEEAQEMAKELKNKYLYWIYTSKKEKKRKMEQEQEKITKSVYTFRSNEKPNISISFEYEDENENENIRDANALIFLGDYILKNYDEAKNNFYLDDVVLIKDD